MTAVTDDLITEPTVHLCWNEHAIRRAAEVLQAANLSIMAADVAAHLAPKPAEPTDNFSVVTARPDFATEPRLLTRLQGHWVDLDGDDCGAWETLHDIEILRVGLGVALPSADPAAALAEFPPGRFHIDTIRAQLRGKSIEGHVMEVEDPPLRALIADLRTLADEHSNEADKQREESGLIARKYPDDWSADAYRDAADRVSDLLPKEAGR